MSATKSELAPLHAELLNRKYIGKTKNVLLFLLPYGYSSRVEESLCQVPFPIITVRQSFRSPDGRSIFPQDIGLVVDGVLHATAANLDQVKRGFDETGIGWIFPRIKTSIVQKDTQGGMVAMSVRNRVALTSDQQVLSSLERRQFHVGLLSSSHVRKLHAEFPEDWTYALSTHVDSLAMMYTNHGHSTLAVDETVQEGVRVDSTYPWKIQTMKHDDATQGVLNMAFLGRDHVLAAEAAEGSEIVEKMRANRHRIIFQPQEVVSDNAGPKCRSLFLSLA